MSKKQDALVVASQEFLLSGSSVKPVDPDAILMVRDPSGLAAPIKASDLGKMIAKAYVNRVAGAGFAVMGREYASRLEATITRVKAENERISEEARRAQAAAEKAKK